MKVLVSCAAVAALSLFAWASGSSFDQVDSAEVGSLYGGACYKYTPSGCRPIVLDDGTVIGWEGCGTQQGKSHRGKKGNNSHWVQYKFCVTDDGFICGAVATKLFPCSYEPPIEN